MLQTDVANRGQHFQLDNQAVLKWLELTSQIPCKESTTGRTRGAFDKVDTAAVAESQVHNVDVD